MTGLDGETFALETAPRVTDLLTFGFGSLTFAADRAFDATSGVGSVNFVVREFSLLVSAPGFDDTEGRIRIAALLDVEQGNPFSPDGTPFAAFEIAVLDPPVIPLPATGGLIVTGLAALAALRRRRAA